MGRRILWALTAVAGYVGCDAFTPAVIGNGHRMGGISSAPLVSLPAARSILFCPLSAVPRQPDDSADDTLRNDRPSIWRRALRRLNTVESAGYDADQVLGAGLFGKIKKIHNPITYFVLGILSGFRWDWCFKSPVYWFAIGFTIKWYRARYVFKIPVWDRQPNWNNIITSKEQEKDLKAFTCKNCGSTIFIAKTREFFFEGNTGIGGLGCFSCGAKGKENFVQNRDEIVDDVGDMDDYFDYEQPLDFVSRAERRKLLKEAQGDEAKANEILLQRSGGGGSEDSAPPKNNDTEKSAVVESENISPVEVYKHEIIVDPVDEDKQQSESSTKTAPIEATDISAAVKASELETESQKTVTEKTEVKQKSASKKRLQRKKSPPNKDSGSTGSFDFDGLDELDMDAF